LFDLREDKNEFDDLKKKKTNLGGKKGE